MIRRRVTAMVVLVAAAGAFAAAVLLPKSSPNTGTGTIATTVAHTTSSNKTTSQPTTTTPPPPPAGSLATPAGRYPVASQSITLTEPAGTATPNGQNGAGQPIRTLPTTLFYPKAKGQSAPDYADGPFPLVVFSEGFNITATSYYGLLRQWASAGFVVAAPTYPFTDPTTSKPFEPDMVYHPADLRYVITVLTKRARGGKSVLHGLLDPTHVGIIGHSDGGDTSLATAANSCCMDPTVNAAAILSGAEWAGFGGTYFPAGTPPLLIVQGDADTINIPGCSVQIYDAAPKPKYFLDIPGAGHEPPYMSPGPWRDGVVQTVVAFFNGYLKHDRSGLKALKKKGSLPGGETLTSIGTLPNEVPPTCPNS